MIKTTGIFILLILCLFTACSDNSRTDHTIIPKPEDSTVTEAIVEEQVSGSMLVDLSQEKNIEKLLCQGWVMEDDRDVLIDNNEPEGIYPFRCFYLYDDFTYTRNNRGFMEYGQWAYNDSRKIFLLKSSGGSKDEYKIAAIGPDDMIVINSGIGSVTQLKFIGTSKKYGDNKDDPYYIDNNRWRIKPKFSESDGEVRKRLKDCIHFYILFYRDNLVRESRQVSFYGFATCIKWYGGGIFMVKEKDLADNWYACFYNKEQAIKAYHMMEVVVIKKYKWNKGNISWVKKNLEVLEQMYNNL